MEATVSRNGRSAATAACTRSTSPARWPTSPPERPCATSLRAAGLKWQPVLARRELTRSARGFDAELTGSMTSGSGILPRPGGAATPPRVPRAAGRCAGPSPFLRQLPGDCAVASYPPDRSVRGRAPSPRPHLPARPSRAGARWRIQTIRADRCRRLRECTHGSVLGASRRAALGSARRLADEHRQGGRRSSASAHVPAIVLLRGACSRGRTCSRKRPAQMRLWDDG